MRIFLTGAGGFAGRHLTDALLRAGHVVTALSRHGVSGHPEADSGLRIVRGDILDAATYRHALEGQDVVVHLAALTGRASREDHERVNAEGTRTVLDACRSAGVPRVLLVSSIAVTFEDISDYPYAQAKAAAEQAVRASGLRFAILRPTMILGAGSPILEALEKLALLPVMPVFGDGLTPVQPIDVDDVAARIVTVLERDWFTGETFEIGGPRALSIESLLGVMRLARGGRPGPVVHLPLDLVVPVLRTLEATPLGRWLPFTVGQLATFRFSGAVRPNRLHDLDASGLRPVEDTIRRSAAGAGASTAEAELAREAMLFTRYLLGRHATGYVASSYVNAHAASRALGPIDRFDARLARAARNGLLTRCADAYARVFQPNALLRRKLIVLLAILETSLPSSAVIDAPTGGRVKTALWLGVQGCMSLLCLGLGTLLFMPMRIVMAGKPA